MTVAQIGARSFGRWLHALSPASVGFLAAGWLGVVAYEFLSGNTQAIAYEVIGLAGVGAIVVGLSRRTAEPRGAWRLFAAGLASEVLGDCISAYYEVHFGHEPPVPSTADIFYLAAPILFAIGIFLLLRELGAKMSRAVVLDAVIVVVALVTVQWVFVVEALVHESLSALRKADEIALPSFDILVLVALIQLVIGPTRRAVPYRMIGLSIFLLFLSDEIFLLTPQYDSGTWIDVGWLGSYVTLGAAALRPGVKRQAGVAKVGPQRLSGPRLAVLAAALLAVPAVLATERLEHHRIHTLVAAGGAALIAVLVLLRLAGLLRAVEQQNRDLRQLDRMKDDFVASVSHELRTPLTSIVGYVELLAEGASGPVNDAQRSDLDVVTRNTGRLLRLVNDLLFAAGLAEGRLDLRSDSVDLPGVVAHSVDTIRPVAAAGGLGLTFEADNNAYVTGDAGRLGQVVDNLVANAVKFTPPGGHVEVRVTRVADEVNVEVKDDGVGIPAADIPHLFDRFFRSSRALTDAVQGTGLGLYIAKTIVEAHGGTIEVVSSEGRGSTFRATFPVARPAV